jgi:hypothetical protein
VAAFNEVPIFWTTTQAGYNDSDRTRRYMRNGKRVVEKLPQSGHVGDYNDKRRARGTRFVKMIDSAGNEMAITLTNAAAHMDPNTGYGQNVRAKARHFGWYAIGECPCALIATGEINREAFMVDSVRDGQPCSRDSFKGDHLDTMCPHAKAERQARMDANKAREQEREEKVKTNESKLLEQQGKILEHLASQIAPQQAAPARTRAKKDDE